jgi:hypothetical protein
MEEPVDRRRWPWLVVTCLGGAIVVLSFLWSLIFPASAEWRPEKAKEYTEVGARLHAQIGELGRLGRNPATRDQELKRLGELRKEHHETQLRWEALREELETTQKRGQSTATILRLTGAGLAVLGMVGWLATRSPK